MCDCDCVLTLLSAQLDGALTCQEQALLAQHLSACPHCGAAAAQLNALHRAMPLLEEEVPQGFHQRLMQSIAADTVLPFPPRRTQQRVWKNWLSTAAVFALLILGGGGLLRLGPALLPPAPEGGQPQVAALPAPTGTLPPTQPYGMFSGGRGQDAAPADPGSAPLAQSPPLPTAPAAVADSQSSGKTLSPPQPTAEMTTDTPQPELGVRGVSLPTPTEEAALALAAARWPDGAATLLYDQEGALTGVQVDTAPGGTETLTWLGLSASGRYHQFCPQGREAEALAVALDGSAILERQAAPEDYDAAMAQTAQEGAN